MVEAGKPGGRHVVGAGPARALRPVPGQGEPCFLAQLVEPVPGAVRPVGVRLAGEQLGVVREGGGKGVVPRLAGRQRESAVQRGCPVIGVNRDTGCQPEVGEVGAEQGGARLAELRERGAGHGQRLGQRAGGRARLQPREQLLAGQVTAHPVARADQEQRAKPPGTRARPRSGRPLTRRDGELAEQPDPDRLPGRCVLCDSCGHAFIIAGRSDILRRFSRGRTRGIPAGRPGRSGRAAAGTPREQGLPNVCSGGRNDEHLVLDVSGRTATERGGAARGGRAGRRTGGDRRPARPLAAAPGDGEPRREAGGSAPGRDDSLTRDPAPSVSGGSAATWRSRRSAFSIPCGTRRQAGDSSSAAGNRHRSASESRTRSSASPY
jgi:hypothetical protein